MAKLITVVNQKGGVGKTTVACHLAFAAQEAGHTVLLVDLDTQGNASQFLTGDMDIINQPGGATQIFQDEEEIEYDDTPHENLKLLHGHDWLKELDADESALLHAAIALRKKIRTLPFDYVIFDTPPAIGPRLAAPLFWSDLAVIAIKPSLAALSGLKKTFASIQSARKRNPILEIAYVINLMNRQSATQKKDCDSLYEKFGSQIIGEFSNRQHVSDALDNFQPVWKYTRDTKLKREWRDFATKTFGMIA